MKKHNKTFHSWSGTPIFISAFIFLMVVSQIVVADNYLDELAVEAEATASVAKKSQLGPDDRNELKTMEELLADKKPSTYKFYVKLNKNNKVHAYEEWSTDTSAEKDRIHHLQKKVLDLYFSQ